MKKTLVNLLVGTSLSLGLPQVGYGNDSEITVKQESNYVTESGDLKTFSLNVEDIEVNSISTGKKVKVTVQDTYSIKSNLPSVNEEAMYNNSNK